MKQPIYNFQHVLIIDDSDIDIFLLKENMAMINYAENIISFQNPLAAFNFLKKSDPYLPDIIFLDLNMPAINGFQFIERCEKELSKSTKFIITTSSDEPSDMEISSKFKSVYKYFIKPITKNDLDCINLS